MSRFTLHIAFALAIACALRAGGQDYDYEAYYLYLGSCPRDDEIDWTEGLQGIAHDNDHWFITQTEAIWKVPVEHDLRSPFSPNPDILWRPLASYPELAGYHHFGDPDVFHYDVNNTDYLLVPIEGSGLRGSIAIFTCADLTYV